MLIWLVEHESLNFHCWDWIELLDSRWLVGQLMDWIRQEIVSNESNSSLYKSNFDLCWSELITDNEVEDWNFWAENGIKKAS
jgi:hypothetical protein